MPNNLEKLFPDNNLQLMVQSGAKGSMVSSVYMLEVTMLIITVYLCVRGSVLRVHTYNNMLMVG